LSNRLGCVIVLLGDIHHISGSQDGEAKLFQLSGQRLLNVFVHATSAIHSEEEMDVESTTGIESVGFSHDQYKWVATGGMDKFLKIWDISSGNCRVQCEHEGGVVSLKWHPTLPFVCTGSIDGVVRVWDARNGNCVHFLPGHANMVTRVDWKFSVPTCGTIISVSDDKTVRLFDVFLQV
jgi:WD40 repeat protein